MNILYNKHRQIVLDTETTGINLQGLPYEGHRVIEIGAVEIINRRFTGNNFHIYINPNRKINMKAFEIHGISNDFLKNKPLFKNIYKKFINYINKSELIIHNASFDVGFLNHEFSLINKKHIKLDNMCNIIDTLSIARQLFPGKKNNLDSLCDRYKVNITNRKLHSAILDAKILAEVYLSMTQYQKKIIFNKKKYFLPKKKIKANFYKKSNIILKANKKEIIDHNNYLKNMKKKGNCIWYNKKKN
ncbi:DNA polymerase III subunit epsilon [Buchnera aphidicola (Taiwanaphis decaspermi)]|uniref:DNA polymerase III subunit epsilon n=1 Tax=Buchnera aphidicola TaxID=9 RepID=UPI0031B80713